MVLLTARHVSSVPTTRRPRPATRVLVLTTFDLDEYVNAALRAGRQWPAARERAAGHVDRAVRCVHAGEVVMATGIITPRG
jgi:DNA-binding NarL/FixJ family response regulator